MALLEALVTMLSPHWVFKNTVGRRRLMMLITKSKNTERMCSSNGFLGSSFGYVKLHCVLQNTVGRCRLVMLIY